MTTNPHANQFIALGLAIGAMAILLWPPLASRGGARNPLNQRRPLSAAFLSQRRSILLAATGTSALIGLIWSPFVAIGLAAIVGVGTKLILDSIGVRRLHRADTADADALAALVAELDSGQDVARAFRAASGVPHAHLSTDLARASRSLSLGASPATALRSASSPRSGELAGLCDLSADHGVPLARAIETMELDLRATHAHHRRVRSLLAGPTATAVTLCLLPLLGIAMGESIGAEPLKLLTQTTLGGVVLVAGVALAVSGVLWTRAMVTKAERS